MSTPELRKKLIARIRTTTDAKLLRAMDRMLKDASREIAPFDASKMRVQRSFWQLQT